ncbi:MAG: degQ [Gammaproteobacteria bacterium]|jgi:Do/DeqQ family serine protease|nr:degQ [Gammaproteobacteria bacterium]
MALIKTGLWIVLFLVNTVTHCFAAHTSDHDNAPGMLKRVIPAVVNIKARIKILDFDTFLRLQKEKQIQGTMDGQMPDSVVSTASGVIVDSKKGYILTNAHAVREASQVAVTLNDGRHYNAKVIGLDVPSDVALLQIQAKNLTAIALGNSNILEVGDAVFAIGNPFGIGQTVTSGIISGLKRSSLGIESLENFIQTDASINPGNSGGALLNATGELIGINTAIVLSAEHGNTGIGLAIPANMAKSVMQQLIEFGDVKRGTLGVGVQDITPDLVTAFNLTVSKGAVITKVLPLSPAEKAGLVVGDVITVINNDEVKNANDVVNDISFLRIGAKANITVLRDNKTMNVTSVILDPVKSREASVKMNPFLYGVSLQDIPPSEDLGMDVKGIRVLSVAEDSNAWQADLHPGDIIISVNQKKTDNIVELNKVIAANKQPRLLLNVLRGAGAVFLVINAEP